MKTIKVLFFLCFITFFSRYSAFGQIPLLGKTIITGKILDSLNREPVPYLAGILQADTLKIGFITDLKGEFSIEVFPLTKKISLRINSKFYEPYEKNLPFNPLNTQLGTIFLRPSALSLQEIEVVGERPTQKDIDKITYTFKSGQAKTSLSSAIFEVPMLTQGREGLMVKGTKPTRIYLDGKLVSQEVLKNLLVENIAQVEVVENPPISEMVEVNMAIINIITKKPSENSIQGNTSIDAGFLRPFYAFGQSLMAKTRKFHINFFANAYTHKQTGTWELNRNRLGQSQNILAQNGNSNAQTTVIAPSLTLFYDFNANTSINAHFTYFNALLEYTNQLNIQNVSSKTVSENRNSKSEPLWTGEVEFRKNFSPHSTLTLTTRLIEQGNDNQYHSDNFETSQSQLLKTDNSLQGKLYVIQANHSLKPAFNRNVRINYGGIGIRREYSTDFVYSSFDQNTQSYQKQASLSQKIDYSQKIVAFFASTTFKWLKTTWQIGGRLERINNQFYRLPLRDQILNQTFYNFIPRLKILRETEKYGTFDMVVSSFVKLPDFSLLNPFIQISNPNSVIEGNLNLRKETHYRTELNHMISNKSQMLTLNSSIYHQFAQDYIIRRTENAQSDSLLTRLYDNIRYFSKTGFSFSLNGFVFKKLMINSTLFAEYYSFDTPYVPTQNRTGITWGINMYMNYKLHKTIQTSFFANYRNFNFDVNSRNYELPSFSLIIQKDWFKDRVSTMLNISDVFNSSGNTSQRYFDHLYEQRSTNFQNLRNISFTIRYNFGKFFPFMKARQGVNASSELKQ